jgi:hypothetical protein
LLFWILAFLWTFKFFKKERLAHFHSFFSDFGWLQFRNIAFAILRFSLRPKMAISINFPSSYSFSSIQSQLSLRRTSFSIGITFHHLIIQIYHKTWTKQYNFLSYFSFFFWEFNDHIIFLYPYEIINSILISFLITFSLSTKSR